MRSTRNRLPLLITFGIVVSILVASRHGFQAADCNQNGADDLSDIGSGASLDCNANAIPDECEQGPGALAFEQHLEYRTAEAAAFVTAGDLDGDARLDLAVANRLAGSVSILRQLPGGKFDEPVHLPSGGDTWRIVVDDLDGDDDLDLVALNNDTDDLSVFRNQGGGSFGDAVHAPTAHFPYRLLSGDLDGDGDTDFTTLNALASSVSVLRNDGGALAPAEHHSTVGMPRAGALADLDGDGDLDIAAANGGERGAPGTTAAVLLNTGGGSFGDASTYGVGTHPWGLAAADFNGDGRLDLATANSGSADVSVLLGTGGGRFAVETRLAAGRNPSYLAAADMDADSDPDLITTGVLLDPEGGFADASDVAVIRSQGDGSFAAPFVTPVTVRVSLSESVSLPRTETVTAVLIGVKALSSPVTGGWLTAATVIVTVAVSVARQGSVALQVKLSVPL